MRCSTASRAVSLALDRHVGEQALFAQAPADQARQLHLVFDNEHSHVTRSLPGLS
jgi:hypothetical protein